MVAQRRYREREGSRVPDSDAVSQTDSAVSAAEPVGLIEAVEPGPLQRQLEALTRAETTPPVTGIDAQIDAMNHLSGRQRDWLKRHSDAITDGRKNTRLGAYHLDAIDAGHSLDSDGYYQFLEEKLGYRKAAPAPKADADDEPEPQTRRSPPVSAPVSRNIPGAPSLRANQVTLSPDERQMAELSGISEHDYALNKRRLADEKRHGMHQERN